MGAKENREVKDSVFVDLFYSDVSAEDNERALYEALHGEPLPEGTTIRKIRIENMIYMNFRNDVSFGVGGRLLVFAEHQATINRNMPLRSLMYIGRAYEQVVPVRDRYKRELVPIPKPEFYTFYNGTQKWEKEKILKLSDAYRDKGGEIFLDLKVKVININPEERHEILDKCPILKEYVLFIDRIRRHMDAGDKEPYRHAIEECMEEGILVDYLRRKGSEVVNMLMAEYDYDMDIEVQREEAMERGIKQGKYETAMNLKRTGMSVEQIAEMVAEDTNEVLEWLSE